MSTITTLQALSMTQPPQGTLTTSNLPGGLGFTSQSTVGHIYTTTTNIISSDFSSAHSSIIAAAQHEIEELREKTRLLEVVRPARPCRMAVREQVQFLRNADVALVDYSDFKTRDIPQHLEVTGACWIRLRDDSFLVVDEKGNWHIEDEEAKVVRLGNNIREWNKYLGSSDLLEEFIKEAGRYGVKQSEFMGIPVELFINWLIYKCAEADGEEPPTKPLVEQKKLIDLVAPRCQECNEPLLADLAELGARFCCGEHQDLFVAKRLAARRAAERLKGPGQATELLRYGLAFERGANVNSAARTASAIGAAGQCRSTPRASRQPAR